MTNFTAVLDLKRSLDTTDDKTLIAMSAQCAEILRQAGNFHAAAYILSLPRDTPHFTAQEIRNTLIQQAKVNLSPYYTQLEIGKRRNDGYGVPCARLSADQPALKGRKIVGLNVLASVGLLVSLGWINLLLPRSSAIAAQPKTVPNPLTIMASNLPSSTVLIPPTTIGGGSLKVINGTNRDAYIKLVEPRSRTLVAAFYVNSSSVFTLKQVPDGTYQLLFVLGENWDNKTQSFRGDKRFARFDRSLNFKTIQLDDRIRYSVFELTLNPVVGGNATTSGVAEQEFRRY